MPSVELLAAVAAFAIGVQDERGSQPPLVQAGDKPPALSISTWIKGETVTSFEPGTVYVVEFWATWCGPCIQAIPHLTELQKKYAGKAVFVGVDTWEEDASLAAPFVAKRGQAMDYRVGVDETPAGQSGRKGKMAWDWLRGAGETGIPSTFIIDQNGKIAWIGHPNHIEEVLPKVLDGGWDVESFRRTHAVTTSKGRKFFALRDELNHAHDAKDFARVDRIAEQINEVQAPIGYGYMLTNHMEWQHDPKGALRVLDRMIADKRYRVIGLDRKYRYLLNDLKRCDEAYALGWKLAKGLFKDDAPFLNMLAWSIVDPAVELPKRDLALALETASRSVQLEAYSANLNTLARVQWLRGDKKKALALAEPDERPHSQKTLDSYTRP